MEKRSRRQALARNVPVAQGVNGPDKDGVRAHSIFEMNHGDGSSDSVALANTKEKR